MWQKLTAGERAKLIGTTLFGAGLIALALGFVYFTYTVSSVLQAVPAILTQVEQTSSTIIPALRELDKIQAQIPPILKEVRLTRELVPPILDEVGALRRQMPAILAEVAAVREALPPLVQTSSKTIQQASDSVRIIDRQIPPILSEVKKTREALPGLLDRADKLVASASTVGRKATSGAVAGVFTGIITTPFRFAGEAGRGLAGAMKLDSSSGFTAKDEQLATAATDAAIKLGQIGAPQDWQTPASKNSGTVTLLDRIMRDQEPCFTVSQKVVLSSGKTHTAQLTFCQHPDGTWAAL